MRGSEIIVKNTHTHTHTHTHTQISALAPGKEFLTLIS